MPFSTTGSVISTDLDNMLRGLYRDNSDHALTGTVAETDLASVSIAANTIGATGLLHIQAGGTFTGAAAVKNIRFYFGGTVISNVASGASDTYWVIDCWIFNTATNAQRIIYRLAFSPSSGVVSTNEGFTNSLSKDTTANQILKITGQLTSAADTITQQMFDVFVCQIT